MSTKSDLNIHSLAGSRISEDFRNPFRYVPSAPVREAAAAVISHIEASPSLKAAFSEGKMLGVLVVRCPSGENGFIAAFSGNVEGRNHIPYFVPPVFDLLSPGGKFRREEAVITGLNREIARLSASGEYALLKEELSRIRKERDEEVGRYRKMMAESKARREKLRSMNPDKETEEALVRESQFQKAQFRRLKSSYAQACMEAEKKLAGFTQKIEELKKRRQEMSESLQDWIFSQYVVSNARGERKSIAEIFACKGLKPPGGTGECAAPKLLQYAYDNGLQPLSMGEFWYGKSPAEEIRESGRFYPSCSGKCGPLLGFMLEGIRIREEEECIMSDPDSCIKYEDESIIVCIKGSGIPSVPGKDGRKSLAEILEGRSADSETHIYPVHRLDMDTAGLIVFAKTEKAQKNLQAQFAGGLVRKTYVARLIFDPSNPLHRTGMKGRISLPLAADIDDRPRQKVDRLYGKEAVTEFEITGISGKVMTVLFRPLTGRTHQLRIHSAHPEGLGSPICGDRLYGGSDSADRLQLVSAGISFRHPDSGETVSFSTEPF